MADTNPNDCKSEGSANPRELRWMASAYSQEARWMADTNPDDGNHQGLCATHREMLILGI